MLRISVDATQSSGLAQRNRAHLLLALSRIRIRCALCVSLDECRTHFCQVCDHGWVRAAHLRRLKVGKRFLSHQIMF